MKLGRYNDVIYDSKTVRAGVEIRALILPSHRTGVACAELSTLNLSPGRGEEKSTET